MKRFFFMIWCYSEEKILLKYDYLNVRCDCKMLNGDE